MEENDGFDITTDEQRVQLSKIKMGTWILLFPIYPNAIKLFIKLPKCEMFHRLA